MTRVLSTRFLRSSVAYWRHNLQHAAVILFFSGSLFVERELNFEFEVVTVGYTNFIKQKVSSKVSMRTFSL